MIREFTLEDGRTASIEIDDALAELMGEEWVEQTLQDQIDAVKKKYQSQE